ncbi:MAG: hypothetical protein ACI976_003121, partial [Aureispira sp.]
LSSLPVSNLLGDFLFLNQSNKPMRITIKLLLNIFLKEPFLNI